MRRITMKKNTFFLAALLLLCAAMAFASGSGDSKAPSSSSSTTSAGGLPIVDKPITIRVLAENRPDRTPSNDQPVFKELEKRTNVRLEWELLPLDEASRNTKFHAIVASGDLPDISMTESLAEGIYAVNRYGQQGIFLALNDLIDQYGPRIKAAYDNPLAGEILPYPINVWGEITASDGKIYCLPSIDSSNAIGPIWAIRTDWLDKLGLKMPATTDELYNVLKAFKTRDPNGNGRADEIPWGSGQGDKTNRITPLVTAFDAHMDFYVDYSDNRIKYGPVEPAYRDALAFINKLYSEGLLEQDYLTASRDQWLARAGGNQMGMHFVWPASGLGTSNNELQKLNPNYHFEPFPPIKSPSGKQYKDTKSSGNAVVPRMAVNAKTKYPVEIIKYIDYLLSDEGNRLAEWGIEGETYTMVNGEPRYTDYILKNPQGKDPEIARIEYGMYWAVFPFQARWENNFQAMSASAPWTVAAWKTFREPGLVEPPFPTLGLNEEELSRRASLLAEINTYKDPMIDKFIMGTEPLSKFTEFTANIRRAGLDELLTMYNKAYDVYKRNSSR
jgi:putative aldouronate transport system substrate-binding protein